MDQREKRKQENNNSLQNESKRSKPNGSNINPSHRNTNNDPMDLLTSSVSKMDVKSVCPLCRKNYKKL
jgi:hypothetical protein